AGDDEIRSWARPLAIAAARLGSGSSAVIVRRVLSAGASEKTCLASSSGDSSRWSWEMTASRAGRFVATAAYVDERRCDTFSELKSGLRTWSAWPTIRVAFDS